MKQGFSSGDAWYRSALWTLIRARARRLLFAYAAVILVALLFVKLYESAPADLPRSPTLTSLPATPQLMAAAASPNPTSTRGLPTVTLSPTNTAVPPPTPTIAQRWQVTERELDPYWEKDWPQVQQIIERFLQQYPSFDPAREKLSVAFYEWGQGLRDVGKREEAAEKFQAALELRPNFTLARNALLALTPTPLPTSTPLPPPTATPVPAPPPVAPRAANPVPVQPAPGVEHDCAKITRGGSYSIFVMYTGESERVWIEITNCGNTTWNSAEYAAVASGITNFSSPLEAIRPGRGTSGPIVIPAQSSPGRYELRFYVARNGRNIGDTIVVPFDVRQGNRR